MKKTALITGASKRIGKAITAFLAEQGWNVIIHFNRSKDEAELLAKELSEKYPSQNFGILYADLSLPGEAERIVTQGIQLSGQIRLLVNNASVFTPGDIKNTSAELFKEQFDINFKVPFFLMRDFANRCGEGNIINLLDTRVTSNASDYAAYSLSKKSLWELTKMAALEFAPKIRVNAIAPGAILSPQNKDKTYLTELENKTPMQTTGGINTVLHCINFILKNENLTGQLLFADGGANLK